MKIADRYRQLAQQSAILARKFAEQPDGLRIDRAVDLLTNATEELSAWSERVGEIPQLQLENKLSPVLLQVHSTLDRARVLYEDAEKTAEGAQIWEVEQLIYRLLNDL